MFRVITSLCVVFALVTVAWTKPDRGQPPAKKKEIEVKLPDLAGLSNWGSITQNGPAFKIEGHSHWFAIGEVRKNGDVFILWTALQDGRIAPGMYKFDGKALVGLWQWGENTETDKDGNITGLTLGDRIYKLVDEVPDN